MWWVRKYHGGTVSGGSLKVKEKMRERSGKVRMKERERIK